MIETTYTENSDVNGDSPQFTLTCVSIGGPVGCVVWSMAKEIIINPNATSVLLDPVQGMYMHNLTVSEVVGGHYSCRVANQRPAEDHSDIYVSGE